MHICRYPIPLPATIPGTDTKLTPDMQAETIARVTTHQRWLRVAKKSPRRAVTRPSTTTAMKYPTRVNMTA